MSLNADIGTITMFAGDFAPLNWAFCNGQILPISQAPELYAIIGTRYGGDGQTSFALPDMRGRAPIRKGTTPGENRNYFVGESGGEREVILGIDELPEHTHDNSGRTNVKAVLKVSDQEGNTDSPINTYLARTTDTIYTQPKNATKLMGKEIISIQETNFQSVDTGGNLGHNNMQPYLVIPFIIRMK